eukprot:GAHX01002704.1.p1 GENE.GAHX01002704.1~~GAHX01002704.1.p1  ORF type:complete len:369 (+),score=44.04 GAHX01002704.1:318-1424(+)
MRIKTSLCILLHTIRILLIDSTDKDTFITPLPKLPTIASFLSNETSLQNDGMNIYERSSSLSNHSTMLNTTSYQLFVYIYYKNVHWSTSTVRITKELMLQIDKFKNTIQLQSHDNFDPIPIPILLNNNVTGTNNLNDTIYDVSSLQDFFLEAFKLVYMRKSILLYQYLVKNLNIILEKARKLITTINILLNEIENLKLTQHEVPTVLENTNLDYIFEEDEDLRTKYKRLSMRINELIYETDTLFYVNQTDIICQHLKNIYNANIFYKKHYKTNENIVTNLENDIKPTIAKKILNSPATYKELTNAISVTYTIDRQYENTFWTYFVSKYRHAILINGIRFTVLIEMAELYANIHNEYVNVKSKANKHLL